ARLRARRAGEASLAPTCPYTGAGDTDRPRSPRSGPGQKSAGARTTRWAGHAIGCVGITSIVGARPADAAAAATHPLLAPTRAEGWGGERPILRVRNGATPRADARRESAA